MEPKPTHLFKEKLSITAAVRLPEKLPASLSRHLDKLHQVVLPPSVYSSGKCGGFEALIPQLLRHTDASRIVRSTTVEDHLLPRRAVLLPLERPVWQHPYRPWNPRAITIVAGPGPYIHHQRRAGPRQTANKLVGREHGDLYLLSSWPPNSPATVLSRSSNRACSTATRPYPTPPESHCRHEWPPMP